MSRLSRWVLVIICLSSLPIATSANNIPIANAGPDQYIFTDNFARLQGSATDPDNDPITSYAWMLATSPAGSMTIIQYPDEADPRFLADTAGQYDLSLLVSDGMDLSNPDFVSVFVADLLLPQAVATASPVSGIAPLAVQFDGSNSFSQLFDGATVVNGTGSLWDDGNLSTFFYDWNFGDGSPPSPVVAPIHTYDQPGIYTVTFGVLDSFGQFSEVSLDVTVNAIPIPSAVLLFGSGLLGLISLARRKKAA